MSLSLQYPGLKLTLALTKQPIVFSHMIGESTYRTQRTGAGAAAKSWQKLSQHA